MRIFNHAQGIIDRDRVYPASLLIDSQSWWIAGGDGRLDSIVFNGIWRRLGPNLPSAITGACVAKVSIFLF